MREINPNATEIHLVNIRTTITKVNAIEVSIPIRLKNPARELSTTPIPKGRNDAAPSNIDS